MMRNIQTREGFEFWDKLNALPRYAFLLSPSGKSVQKFEDQAMGNWIDVHEAQKVVDQAQDQISELRASYRALGELYAGTQKGFERMQAERDALQMRLNAADQRNDELSGMLQHLVDNPYRFTEAYRERIAAALNPSSKTPDQLRDATKMIGIERMPPMEYDEP